MIFEILTSIFVAWLTYRMIQLPKVSPTLASSSVSLLFFALLWLAHPKISFDFHYFASLAFGASFVGMCSHKTTSDKQVLTASIIFVFLFNTPQLQSIRLGGALGFAAFISSLSARLIFKRKLTA